MGGRLLHVLHGDEADAAIIAHRPRSASRCGIDAAGACASSWSHALAHRDQTILGHQLGDGLIGLCGEAHIAVGEDADELARLPLAPRSTTGMPEMPCRLIKAKASPSVSSGKMVIGFTTMPLSNFFTWRTWSAWASRRRGCGG